MDEREQVTMDTVVGIIPSRLQSSRLPQKALLDICGLPMFIHVYRRCQLAKKLDRVIVATDSEGIMKAAAQHGCEAIMTQEHHQTGTDRIAEVAAKIDCDIVVNIQGDEALVNPRYIDQAIATLEENKEMQIALLVNPFNKQNSPSDIKVVINEQNEIMYMSRADIPSDARTPNPPLLKAYHIVPFRKSFLLKYASWGKGKLEQIEFNEYLRILEKGHKIKAVLVESDAVSVDTIQDLEYVRSKMPDDPFYRKYKS